MPEQNGVTRRSLFKGAAAGAVAAQAVGALSPDKAAAAEPYDAIVIGTGFGGSVATLALHFQNKKVLVLERGTFFVTPETLGSPPPGPSLAKWAADNGMRVQNWSRPDHKLGLIDLLANTLRRGNPYGLYQYSMFDKAHILTGSGVGGGSLIYSNVNIRAPDPVLQRIGLTGLDYGKAERFMQTYRGKFSKVVTKIPLPPGVAPESLGVPPTGPDKDALAAKGYLLLDRSRALREAGAAIAAQLGVAMPWSPLNLSVTEYVHAANSESDAGHTFCERQGRCMLGCLPQARHTFNKTLFKFVFSKDNRVVLSPESEARSIARTADGYEVAYLDRRGNNPEGRPVRVQARQVFVAAGVLGTTELLMRSQRDKGLQLSDRLGYGFSTNGDFGALAVGTKLPDGTKRAVYPTRGPINTCELSVEIDGRHYTIEDCGIPAMFAEVVRDAIRDRSTLFNLTKLWPPTLASAGELLPNLPFFGPWPAHPTEPEMIDDVFFFNAMGEDSANGRFTLKGDRLDLDWETPIGEHPVFATIEQLLTKLSQAMGGTYTPLPTWEGLLPPAFAKKTLIVTHPLGGCRVGPSMAEGVVTEFGEVYDGSKRASDPRAVHPGLYIVDGSVIPGALAANPTLTISAQAIRAVEHAVGPIPNI
jgi:cholesterol oxidase